MRAGDSTAFRAVLHPSATAANVSVREGQPTLAREASLEGFVQAVGFDLYLRMLDETVNRLTRGESGPKFVPADVSMDIPAFLPDDYIELVNPLWTTHKLQARVEAVWDETHDARTITLDVAVERLVALFQHGGIDRFAEPDRVQRVRGGQRPGSLERRRIGVTYRSV